MFKDAELALAVTQGWPHGLSKRHPSPPRPFPFLSLYPHSSHALLIQAVRTQESTVSSTRYVFERKLVA